MRDNGTIYVVSANLVKWRNAYKKVGALADTQQAALEEIAKWKEKKSSYGFRLCCAPWSIIKQNLDPTHSWGSQSMKGPPNSVSKHPH